MRDWEWLDCPFHLSEGNSWSPRTWHLTCLQHCHGLWELANSLLGKTTYQWLLWYLVSCAHVEFLHLRLGMCYALGFTRWNSYLCIGGGEERSVVYLFFWVGGDLLHEVRSMMLVMLLLHLQKTSTCIPKLILMYRDQWKFLPRFSTCGPQKRVLLL